MIDSRTSRFFVLAAVVALAAACSTRPEAAGTDARFQGQILRIVVGRSPGGTYDLYARAMAQYFGRYVPGHPTVVVENMPGAGGLLALKYLARQARPDGLTIGQVGLPGTLANVTDDAETQADAAKFHALGSPADDVPVCVFSRESGIDLNAWRTRHLRPRLGVTSYGTSSQINTALMSAALQLPARVVVGYKGTAEIRQAIASRELDGACVGVDAYFASFEPKDDYVVALQLGGGATSDLDGVPSLSTLVTDARGRELLDVSRLIGRISRYYAVPPGTSPEIVEILRHAFDATMRDPEFLRVAKRANLPINPRAAAAVEQSVTELLNLSSAVRDRVWSIVKPSTP
jgi:tripartite-type tricarboxylate transporter receptor subunit TctC